MVFTAIAIKQRFLKTSLDAFTLKEMRCLFFTCSHKGSFFLRIPAIVIRLRAVAPCFFILKVILNTVMDQR